MPHMNAARFLVVEATQLKLLEGSLSLLTAMVVFLCIGPPGRRLRGPLPALGLGLIFICDDRIFVSAVTNSPEHYSWIVILAA